MSIDHQRLVDGFGAAAALVDEGAAGLAAVNALIVSLREATGAVGATFTEYGEDGGRVVIATGEMAWSLGQPIGPYLVKPGELGQPWAGRVDMLAAPVAEALLVRGVLALSGHPVRRDPRA